MSSTTDQTLVRDLRVLPDINKYRYDQSTFSGRLQHFYGITNPFNLLASNNTLLQSRKIVENYQQGQYESSLTVGELWRAKRLFDSAFHPETGEKMFVFSRMSSMLPCGMIICSGMMVFYKSTPGVVFWQWLNQSYNAGVNYANRSGRDPVTNKQLLISYVSATSGALVTALGLNSLVKSLPSLIGRIVPWCAVAAANCVNIPLVRLRELREGIALMDSEGNHVGNSKSVAQRAIAMVTFCRILMVTPVMVIPPIIVEYVQKRPNLRPILRYNVAFQTALCGLIYIFAVPGGCAVFPQTSSIAVSKLEPAVQQQIRENAGERTKVVYYNKGL